MTTPSIEQDLRMNFGPMEFFILAVVDKGGLNSLYQLQRRAHLQSGGIRPALTRLEGAGFLKRSKQTTHNRRPLIITEKGKKFLKRNWKWCLRQDLLDREAILRAICVAVLMGDIATAVAHTAAMADNLDRAASEVALSAERRQHETDPLAGYRQMRATIEAATKRAEAAALREISAALAERIHEKH